MTDYNMPPEDARMLAEINASIKSRFQVEPEYHGQFCEAPRCGQVVQEGDEWGEQWTSDDDGHVYCADHSDRNPTSDNFLDTPSGFVEHCGGCGGIVEGDDPFREFCDKCGLDTRP